VSPARRDARGDGLAASPSRPRRRTLLLEGRSSGFRIARSSSLPGAAPCRACAPVAFFRRPSPVTATGSRRILTGFPQPPPPVPSSWRRAHPTKDECERLQPSRGVCPRHRRTDASTVGGHLPPQWSGGFVPWTPAPRQRGPIAAGESEGFAHEPGLRGRRPRQECAQLEPTGCSCVLPCRKSKISRRQIRRIRPRTRVARSKTAPPARTKASPGVCAAGADRL